MITQPLTSIYVKGVLLQAHQVYSTYTSILKGTFSIVVGSWPTTISGKPWAETTLTVLCGPWKAEYYDQADQIVNAHPDWANSNNPRPSVHHIFNMHTLLWEDPRDLQELKKDKWDSIKQSRALTEYAGFIWEGSSFDSDTLSQSRITGAVTLAMLAKQVSTPYEITWTLADRTFRVLSVDEMVSVGLALGTHVQTNFNRAQELQARIEAATTKEEVEAITW